MTRFSDETEAQAAGFVLRHLPAAQRFVLLSGEREIGEAHYQLLGENGINFNYTGVHPDFRGTGLSGVLAQHAFASPLAQSRTITASCWFMAQYLRDHPELLATHS